MDYLPKDPAILVSSVNMLLRDEEFDSLESLCYAFSRESAIPEGQVIDNSDNIDYDQLYAQLVYEVKEQQSPYWFNNDEVARIQELNQEFMGEQDMAKIVRACFRKPKEGEKVKSFNCTQLLEVILNEFPTMVVNKSTRIYLGRAMSELGFEKTDHGHITFYKAVPRKAS